MHADVNALICVSEPTFPGCLVPARAIGLFRMAGREACEQFLLTAVRG